ncbi:unnamed protein product [Rotaria magnacalcarata]|uniref:Reticulon-like protein n=1 Tax=Rotaria magnacalcarata TaxID=392030 RepID=A0A8S2IZC4_9BILA|nr:unnamed protein product [Rotaria magnacalcarata]
MDPTTDSWNKSSSNDRNEASTTESISQNYTPVDDSYVQKGRTELKHGQQHAENIVSKTKRILQRHSISKQQADELAEQIQVNGTSLLKHARNIFLWQNLTNSAMFGLVLFIFFYIGLSMNTLTLGLVSLIFLFTVPKIYEVYQVPIDRTAKQILDQINQLLAKVTAKLPNKAKKA